LFGLTISRFRQFTTSRLHLGNAMLTPDLLATLATFDTPTICNALEIVAPERRLTGFTIRPLVCPFPDLAPVVGYARTATIRATHANELKAPQAKAQRVAYYEYIASGGPQPSITVIQDLDGAEVGFGAFWGEVQSTVHKALGSIGVVTDGCIRDIPQWAPGLQVLAGSIAPSHGHVHLADFGREVRVSGMLVRSGDLIHMDRHGAVVIPEAVAAKIPAACDLLARKEAVILDMARAPGFTIDKLKAALQRQDEIH
jgi:regulator of RNase E activity RraA